MIPTPTQAEVHPKGWGRELWLTNSAQYAFKILEFRAGARSSFHYHLKKTETWYIFSGTYAVSVINPETAAQTAYLLVPGSVLHLPAGIAHQVSCSVAGQIAEASTQHDDRDTHRIAGGDSQQCS